MMSNYNRGRGNRGGNEERDPNSPTNLTDDRGSGRLGTSEIGIFRRDWNAVDPNRFSRYPTYYDYGYYYPNYYYPNYPNYYGYSNYYRPRPVTYYRRRVGPPRRSWFGLW